MIGRRFGRLVVKCLGLTSANGDLRWECECDCGQRTLTTRANLIGKRTRSCGCLRDELLTPFNSESGTRGGAAHKRMLDQRYAALKPYRLTGSEQTRIVTILEREALPPFDLAARLGLPRGERTAPWRRLYQNLRRLVTRGLLFRVDHVYYATDAGRAWAAKQRRADAAMSRAA